MLKSQETLAEAARVIKASSLTDTKLYRLRVLEEDEENGCVKVGYIGFGDE